MKKMLLIAPNFYNYHEIIKSGFENQGFEVDYYDDRPSTGFWTRALIRINRSLIKGKVKRYFRRILNETRDIKYDVVLVIYGQSFSKYMFEQLREEHKESRFIFYMYDPISSMPDRVDVAKIFDDCYSFDYNDCIKYPNFKLVPLFYSFDDFEKSDIIYDACFITTMMPGKYQASKKMIKGLEEKNFNIFKYQFIQSKLVYLYYKILKKDFKGSKAKEFCHKRMSYTELNRMINSSKYIIDCPKEGQTGLTIKTFETLAANKKLITNNKTIVNYDFYRPENIYIYNGEYDFDDIFFNSEFVPISDEIKKNYSLESWAKKILANFKEEEK